MRWRAMSAAQDGEDIIFNRSNVNSAKTQRLIDSWMGAMGAPSAADDPTSKTEEQLQREDEELFNTGPET